MRLSHCSRRPSSHDAVPQSVLVCETPWVGSAPVLSGGRYGGRPDDGMLPTEKHAIAAAAVGAVSFGALAVGVLAFGAIAIGRLAINRMVLRKGKIAELRIGRLIVDELEIRGLEGQHATGVEW